MPEALSSIGGFLNSGAGKSLFSIAGLGSNIAGSIQNAQQQSQYNSAQSYLKNIITNPTAYNAAVAKYTQPLNQGLVTNVENLTNANLAERGLGSSGAISQQVLAQALAPYIQQNQQTAQNALQTSLGNISQLRPTGGNQFTDISKILAGLKGGTPGAPGLTLPNGITGADPLGLNGGAPTPGATDLGQTLPPDLSSLFSGFSLPEAWAVPYATGNSPAFAGG